MGNVKLTPLATDQATDYTTQGLPCTEQNSNITKVKKTLHYYN